MDNETKEFLKSTLQYISVVAARQGIILELLARKLPDMSEEERHDLRAAGKANKNTVEDLRNTIDKW